MQKLPQPGTPGCCTPGYPLGIPLLTWKEMESVHKQYRGGHQLASVCDVTHAFPIHFNGILQEHFCLDCFSPLRPGQICLSSTVSPLIATPQIRPPIIRGQMILQSKVLLLPEHVEASAFLPRAAPPPAWF